MGTDRRKGMVAIEARYDAFISYNHGADSELAPAVERGLQRLAKPWYRLRALSVFRDLSDTGLNDSLWGTVQRQLDGSRWLIVMACPESAASPWVQREVGYWCDTKGVETVLLVLTGGELAWDREHGGFAPASTALSPEIAARFASEPLHLDLRWAKVGVEPSLRLARFRADMARLASPIRDLPPDEIEGEDIRLHRKARRLARTAVAMLVTLAVVASIAAVVAVVNARRADRRAREAIARQVGLLALDMPASELDRALLLSVVAADLDPSGGLDRYRASRTLLGRNARLTELFHAPPLAGDVSLRGVAVSPDGTRIAATGSSDQRNNQLFTWEVDRPGEPTSTPLPRTTGPGLAFGPDSEVIVGGVGDVLAAADDRRTTSERGTIIAIDVAGRRAIVTAGTTAHLVDTVTGEAIREWNGANVLADLAGPIGAIVVDSELQLLDPETGTTLASAALADEVASVALEHHDDRISTISVDGRITRWLRAEADLRGSAVGSTAVPVGIPEMIAVGAGHEHAVVVGDAGSAIVELDTGRIVATNAGTGVLSVDPSRRYAAVGGAGLVVWDLSAGLQVTAAPEKTNAMAWSGCSNEMCRLATVGESIDVWEPATGRRTRLADQTNAQSVGITEDGSRVVSAGWGSAVAMWELTVPVDDSARHTLASAGTPVAVDATTGAIARVVAADTVEVTLGDQAWRLRTGPVSTMYLVDAATRLITLDDADVHLFDVAGAARIDVHPACNGGLIAISPLGRRFVAHRVSDGRTAVCNTQDGALIGGANIAGAATPAAAVAVDDDGSVALGGNGFVDYHALTGGGLGDGLAVDVRFGGEPVTIESMALRRGHVVAGVRPRAPAQPARALIWDAVGQGTAVQFDTDHRHLPAVALIGDNAEILLTAGRSDEDGAVVVQVWERDTRRRLGRGLGGLAGDVVALGGGASELFGTDADGRAFSWSLEQDPSREVCEIVGRPLTRDEWSSIADGVLDRYEFIPVCSG